MSEYASVQVTTDCHCGRNRPEESCLFWKMVYSGPLSIFETGFCCCVTGVLYMCWTLISHQIRDVHVFSPVLWVIIFCWQGPWMHKSLKFSKSSFCWTILLLLPLLLVSHLRNHCQIWCHELPLYSSKSFVVLVCAFRALSHFELISVYVVGEGPSFILLHVDVHFLSVVRWEDCPFRGGWSWHPYWESGDCVCWLISGLSVLLVGVSVLTPVPCCLRFW